MTTTPPGDTVRLTMGEAHALAAVRRGDVDRLWTGEPGGAWDAPDYVDHRDLDALLEHRLIRGWAVTDGPARDTRIRLTQAGRGLSAPLT